MRLDLTDKERKLLRANKIKKEDIPTHDSKFLADRLDISDDRATELSALAVFQGIRSLGYEFARDMIGMGYYTLESIKDKSGAALLDEHEKTLGYFTDPCVEDQFRRLVHYANTGDNSLSWFDFTSERKKFRSEHGYPEDRPTRPWFEVKGIKAKQ